ncbi:MAG TPA: D-alanyl-D-alanine carboxypeptidase/D-alanyl-D-alanine-endopeptidase [Vicinamibacterales bacterium]|jgi:D-alanyl-D-alanine carboxypeptidase/D-alanyl-D-alanine-endopeptidase (penicillin-binding protein 4)|nr:D-alanyl-D-alanine carboxypeptidase/D-alanyl-D-alanine-endopeptidase [Vicinamibacterales bacterium]
MGRPACRPILLVAVLVSACHATTRPATSPALPALPGLVRDIDAILAQPALDRGYWAVLVKSLKSDETLYTLNARKLMMPASNMKIVTLAAAAERLGWDYTYETQILAVGAIDAGTLDGDLLVVGSGDPSLVAADGMSSRVFDDWAERMKALGVRTILGRVVGDDNAFDDEELGFGWSWDDLPDDYAAGVSALQFNENAARVTIRPGAAAGDSASVDLAPAGTGLVIDNALKTGAADTPPSIAARRLPGSSRLELRGSIPVGAMPVTRVVSVDNPTLFAVTALRDALIARGIDIRGPAIDVDSYSGGPCPPDGLRRDPSAPLRCAPSHTDGVLLISYRSPPLATLAVRLMKASQNLYAETLLKTLGASAAAGRATVQATLQAWGVPADALIQRDGSGLSRYDYVTADALVAILTHIDRDEKLRGPYEASLPIAGRDGTLANRMKGTAAEGTARAKTGSMSNVRALSGYVTTADGEPLVFSILANNFETAADVINRATDAIVVRLALFRR